MLATGTWRAPGGGRGRRDQTHRNGHHRVCDEELGFPVEEHAAVKVASCLDCCDARHYFLGAIHPSSNAVLIFTVQPFLIGLAEVNWAVEEARPF